MLELRLRIENVGVSDMWLYARGEDQVTTAKQALHSEGAG